MQQEIDNQMLVGLARQDRKMQQREDAEARAWRMLKDEFVLGLQSPLLPISTPGYESSLQEQRLVDVVIDQLLIANKGPAINAFSDLLMAAANSQDPEILRPLLKLAQLHADNHTRLLAAEGAFLED